MFQEVLVGSVYLLMCVFVGEKRGLGGNRLGFFGRLMSVRTFLSQPQNDLLSCFALFFPLAVCVAHVFPGILTPIGWGRRDMGGVTCVCRNICVGAFVYHI